MDDEGAGSETLSDHLKRIRRQMMDDWSYSPRRRLIAVSRDTLRLCSLDLATGVMARRVVDELDKEGLLFEIYKAGVVAGHAAMCKKTGRTDAILITRAMFDDWYLGRG